MKIKAVSRRLPAIHGGGSALSGAFPHCSEPLTGAASCFRPRRQLRGGAGSSLARLTQHQCLKRRTIL